MFRIVFVKFILSVLTRNMGCGSSSASKGAVVDSTKSILPPNQKTVKTQPLNQLEIPAYGYTTLSRGSIVDDQGSSALSSQRPSFQYIENQGFEVDDEQKKLQYICDTDITLEWLYERLTEKFKCEDEPEPQWIAERLNVLSDKGKAYVSVEHESKRKSIFKHNCC